MTAHREHLDSILHIIGSASLTPTEHLLLKGFVTGAADPEYVAQYIYKRIEDSKDGDVEEVLRELKRDWRQLVQMCE